MFTFLIGVEVCNGLKLVGKVRTDSIEVGLFSVLFRKNRFQRLERRLPRLFMFPFFERCSVELKQLFATVTL